MIAYLVAWLGLSILCVMIGTSVVRLFGCPTSIARPADRLIASLWVGLLTLASALLATSLVVPLRPAWCLLVAFGLSLPALCSKDSTDILRDYAQFLTLPLMLSGVALALAMAWFVLRGTLLEDAHIYHIPRIRWYSEYGTVPGLALLEPHLGYASSWHALTAPFDAGFLCGRAYALINGFLCTLFSANFILVGWRLYRAKMQVSDWFLATASVIYFSTCFRQWTQIIFSPSPDIAVILVTVMIGWMLLVEGKRSEPRPRAALFCSLGALSLKLSLAPVVAIVTLVELWQLHVSPRQLVRLSFVAVGYALPFLLAQFISSGFPLYPITVPNLQVDWGIDLMTAELEAKLPALTVPYGFHPTSPSNAPSDWSEMFSNLFHNQSYLMLFSTVNLMICGALAFSTQKLNSIKTLACIGLIGNIFILSSAPDIRYGLCYVHVGLSTLVALFASEWLGKKLLLANKGLRVRVFYIYLLAIALAFFPLRISVTVLLLAWVGSMALLFRASRLEARLRALNLPLRWTPAAAALTVAGCLMATSYAKDATEMVMASYAGAGLFRLPDNSVPKWLLPPPTVRYRLTVKGPEAIVPVNARYETKIVGGHRYLYPIVGFCSDAELPCGSYGIRSDIRWRDPRRGLAGGFSRSR